MAMLGSLLGGIGLFLLGMHLMTDGLKMSAGGALRSILDQGTKTAFRGILSGAAITAVVQSSSAVTVAIIGFVNAGLMTLRQSVGVIYGSNIGTTMTGWLVALVGFNVNIKVIALPAIGIGMALRIVFSGKRPGAAGLALAGFGIFFMGIGVLATAFQDLGQCIQLEALFIEGFGGLFLFVGIGFGLTMLMQSSSAAMAVTLTASAGGLIPLSAGAALVIGANLGTTSTAALSVIGATPNAKRVAGAHVAFNVITGALALLILPLFLSALVTLRKTVGLADDPAPLLALFHTLFNTLGVLLMWPLTRYLVRFLKERFRVAEEEWARPKYLDRNVLATPTLAMEALFRELGRIGEISRRMCRRAVRGERHSRVQGGDRRALNSLVKAVGDFAGRMRQGGMPEQLSNLVPNALRVARYYSEAAELAERVAGARVGGDPIETPELVGAIKSFEGRVKQLLKATDSRAAGYSAVACGTLLSEILKEYQALKSGLLKAGADGLVKVGRLVAELDMLSDIRRIGEQVEKGSRYLADLTEKAATP